MRSEPPARPPAAATRLGWPAEVDRVLGGDVVVAVGTSTPEGGVVVNPVPTLGMRDRDAGTVSFVTAGRSALGARVGPDRLAIDPRVAVAYHTRRHGHVHIPGHVLVQGRAEVRSLGDPERRALLERREEHLGRPAARGRFWGWWLEPDDRDLIVVDVHVDRLLWWADDDRGEETVVLGVPPPAGDPPSQPPPDAPVRPRVPMRKLRRVAGRPHRVLGVLDAEGSPLLVPVGISHVGGSELRLTASSSLLPQGQRRAGLLIHEFHPRLVGARASACTGWLRVVGDLIKWTPHSHRGRVLPPNETLLRLAEGAEARRRRRRAAEHGDARATSVRPGHG
jgi:hypothetical protein